MNNGGVLRGNNVITYAPEGSTAKQSLVDRSRLTVDEFDNISEPVFDELGAMFAEPPAPAN